MSRTEKALVLAVILVVALMLMGCFSTACMSNAELTEWLSGTATPVACW